MKRILILMMSAAIWSACSNSNGSTEKTGETKDSTSKETTFSGSTTIAPLALKVARSFHLQHDDFNFTISAAGSGVGIADLENNATDIAMSSRDMNDTERKKFEDSKKPVTEVKIASDALAVIVNPATGVDKLTREQLEKVFAGDVSNWKELGGKDIEITVFSRETTSGTYEFFKETVMKTQPFSNLAKQEQSNDAVRNNVMATPGGVGYVGLAFINDKVKAVTVSFDGKTYIAPNIEDVKNKTYPLTRPLFLIYHNSIAGKVKPFMDYLLSAQGQKEAEEIGYVSLQ